MTGVPPSLAGGVQVRVMEDGEVSVASGLPGASGTSVEEKVNNKFAQTNVESFEVCHHARAI